MVCGPSKHAIDLKAWQKTVAFTQQKWKSNEVNEMKGTTLGIPNEIMTILAIDAVIIGLYAANFLKEKHHLIGAKILGTSVLVGASLLV